MKYEMSPNIDRQGERKAVEAQREIIDSLEVDMGETYKTILEKIANDVPLDPDEQDLIDSMKEKFSH